MSVKREPVTIDAATGRVIRSAPTTPETHPYRQRRNNRPTPRPAPRPPAPPASPIAMEDRIIGDVLEIAADQLHREVRRTVRKIFRG